jgi:hypothetical protein
MTLRVLLLAALLAPLPLAAAEATATGAPAGSGKRKSGMWDAIRARMLEEAKKTPAPAPESEATKEPSAEAAVFTAPAKSRPAPAAGAAPPPVMMPQVEVRQGRITELDQQLAKQDQAIARERKNITATETDTAMNDLKIARPLAIFGGESTQFRQRVAIERVELMEAEKDLMEAIARAGTKAEKDELQKQLNEMKAMRRDLERALR